MEKRKNNIRHQILKLLIERHKKVLEEYGGPEISEMDEERLGIAVSEIINKLKITYDEFEAASAKAFADKAYKLSSTQLDEDYCEMTSNSKPFYHEKKYLIEGRYFFETEDFKKSLVMLIIGTLLGFVVSNLNKTNQEKTLTELVKKVNSQDSALTNLKSYINNSNKNAVKALK